MSERLLSRKEIAERLSTSPGVAVEILAQNGVQPVFLGRGRHRGYRWSSTAVDDVIVALHEAAQTSPQMKMSSRFTRNGKGKMPFLAGMSNAEIFALTQAHNVQ